MGKRTQDAQTREKNPIKKFSQTGEVSRRFVPKYLLSRSQARKDK
jgi:hypothetical protein